MAQTFDIRFARSAGLAAMFEAPTNTFRWTGSGRLSIDAHGISVAARRGLLSLLARNRTRRILTANLKQVFREGDALRVEFATDDSSRASLQFWAANRDAAAKIVQLLPTSRTVEIEDGAAARKFQFDRRMLGLLGVVVVAIVGASVWLRLSGTTATPAALAAAPGARAATPEASTPAVEAPAIGAPTVAAPTTASHADPRAADRAAREARDRQRSFEATPSLQPVPLEGAASIGQARPASSNALAQPEMSDGGPLTAYPPAVDLLAVNALPLPPRAPPGADAFVVPIQGGTPAWNEALRQLALFGSESDDLLAEYGSDNQLFAERQISRREFATRLSRYEQRWWDVTFRILDTDAFSDPALTGLRATLLASARYRRHFLALYAEGLRRPDEALIRQAFSERERADELGLRARRYID